MAAALDKGTFSKATASMLITIILAFLLSLSSPALAGHAAWEQYTSTGNIDYVIMNPNGFQQTWPDKTIRYCFSDSQAKKVLEWFIPEGMTIWYARGLGDEFQMIEIPLYECLADRANTLFVRLGTTGWYATTGRQTPPGEAGPVMQMSAREGDNYHVHDLAILHLIGHAWGLVHEHQNPMLWTGLPSDPLIFECQNLVSFDSVHDHYALDGDAMMWGEDGLCFDYWEAAAIGFEAMQFLPMPGHLVQSRYIRNFLEGDTYPINYHSVMLYNSDKYAKPGTTTLRRKDPRNPFIERNVVPSQGDVMGIERLYASGSGEPQEPLHSWPSSLYFAEFQNIVMSTCQ